MCLESERTPYATTVNISAIFPPSSCLHRQERVECCLFFVVHDANRRCRRRLALIGDSAKLRAIIRYQCSYYAVEGLLVHMRYVDLTIWSINSLVWSSIGVTNGGPEIDPFITPLPPIMITQVSAATHYF